METIRFWFRKTGRAKYISHLDLMRAMTRTLRRAGLPLWYTEGFHPHLRLTFGQPLSLGFESECEAMEVRVTAPVDRKAALVRLGELLPPDLAVYRVEDAAPPLTDIAYSEYKVTLRCPATEEDCVRFAAEESVPVEKKSKSGVAVYDLAPHLHMVRAERVGDALVLDMVLPSGQNFAINPQLVADAFLRFAGYDCAPSVRRVAVLDKELRSIS